MVKKDQKDPILIEKLEKLLKNTDYNFQQITNVNKSIIRPNWNKYYEKEVKKYEKTLLKKFIYFWDIAKDHNPKFCFITGLYIPPRFKTNLATQPFKNGEWCYKEDYDKYINHNHISENLDENSMIICIASQPKEIIDKTTRPRIKNNLGTILDYITQNIKNFDEKDIPQNLIDIDLKLIKYKYFLKPNGKRFPKPRNMNR